MNITKISRSRTTT